MWGRKEYLLYAFMASQSQINDGPANGKLPEGIGIVIIFSRFSAADDVVLGRALTELSARPNELTFFLKVYINCSDNF